MGLKLSVKNFIIICLFTIVVSCKKNYHIQKISEIDKAIELVSNKKIISDTLEKWRHEQGVEFIACYITITDKHRILGFQVLQSKSENMPPLKIDRPYKIKTFQGVYIFFSENEKDRLQDHKIDDNITKELIKKGYLTINGRTPIIDSKTTRFIFCKKDENHYTALSSDFMWDEEVKARNNNKPFIMENYYPKCE